MRPSHRLTLTTMASCIVVTLFAGAVAPLAAQTATDRLIESQKAMLDAIQSLQQSQTTELKNTRFLAAQTRDTAAKLSRAVDSLRISLDVDKRADSLRLQVATQAGIIDSLKAQNARLAGLVQQLVNDTTRLSSASGVVKTERDKLADSLSKLTVTTALANQKLSDLQANQTNILAQIQQQYQDMLERLPEPKKKN